MADRQHPSRERFFTWKEGPSWRLNRLNDGSGEEVWEAHAPCVVFMSAEQGFADVGAGRRRVAFSPSASLEPVPFRADLPIPVAAVSGLVGLWKVANPCGFCPNLHGQAVAPKNSRIRTASHLRMFENRHETPVAFANMVHFAIGRHLSFGNGDGMSVPAVDVAHTVRLPSLM
jgi:hypothetical protein